jgi:hypothetical protein
MECKISKIHDFKLTRVLLLSRQACRRKAWHSIVRAKNSHEVRIGERICARSSNTLNGLLCAESKLHQRESNDQTGTVASLVARHENALAVANAICDLERRYERSMYFSFRRFRIVERHLDHGDVGKRMRACLLRADQLVRTEHKRCELGSKRRSYRRPASLCKNVREHVTITHVTSP